MTAPLPARTRLALGAGRVAGRLSLHGGRGRGGVIGGRLALAIDARALERLADGRTTILVSATNGKSTTTALLAAAVATLGETAYNGSGSNMAAGIVVALGAAVDAPFAVLETDEAYLGTVAAATRPRALVLMNLSPDFLERGVRVKRLARHWRDTLAAAPPETVVVANADDPIVAWSARDAPAVVWVAGGDRWLDDDGATCPDCTVRLARNGELWWCERCGWARPEPSWWLADDGCTVEGPGVRVGVRLSVPGRMNAHNAVFALAAATALGAATGRAAAALEHVRDIDGRYGRRDVGGRPTRLLLAKNPASWQDAVGIAAACGDALVFHLTARSDRNAKDASLAWDAPIERLAGRVAVAAGIRAADMALRLEVAGLDVRMVADPVEAIRSCPPGPVTVIGNYPAFMELRDRLPPARPSGAAPTSPLELLAGVPEAILDAVSALSPSG